MVKKWKKRGLSNTKILSWEDGQYKIILVGVRYLI